MDPRLQRRLRRLAAAGGALTLAMGLVAWPRLPATMAIHFGPSGTPDTFVPKAVGVAVIPATLAATAVVFRQAFRVDPPEDPRVPVVVAAATYLLLAGLQALVVGWNLGYRPPFGAVLAGIGLWTVAVVGYVLVAERT